MVMPIEPPPVPLVRTSEGVIRVSGTRVPVETVVRAFQQGATPEEIAQDYPLTLANVYAVIAYYLWHREAVDAYVAERTAIHDATRATHEAHHPDLVGIRVRLQARIAAQEDAA